jgi:hypothetical protein
LRLNKKTMQNKNKNDTTVDEEDDEHKNVQLKKGYLRLALNSERQRKYTSR